jgi:hypothetical protein
MAHSIEARLDRSIAARTVEQATFMFDPAMVSASRAHARVGREIGPTLARGVK